MRIVHPFSIGFLALCTWSCVNQAYDMKEIQDMNTDVNFGGEHFSIPIGSFEPIYLSRFIQAGDLLKITEGRYEFSYQNNQTTNVPAIAPIDFTVASPSVAGVPVNLDDVSINDIDLPNIKIDKTVSATVLAGQTSATVRMDDVTSPINILYEYTHQIKRVNYILFGAPPATEGERLEVALTSDYGAALTNGSTEINSFTITFPYGFALSLDPSDPYSGVISADKKQYTVTSKTLQTNKKFSFFVKQITFDPSRDQTLEGQLRYNQNLTYTGDFTLSGTATAMGGPVGVSLLEDRPLTLKDGNFDTNTITTDVPTQETPVEIDKQLDDPSIQSIRKVTLKERTPIHVVLDVNGLPARVAGLTLKDYTVRFPDFMLFEDLAINASKTLVLNEAIPNNGQLDKVVYLTGFVFTTNPIRDGRMVVSDHVTSLGKIVIDPIDALSDTEVQNVIVKPTIVLGTMDVGTLEAVVKPDVSINPIEIKVDLASDMEFLRQSVLDLDRVALQVRVENATGLAAQMGVKLTPYDQNNSPLTDNAVEQKTGMIIKPKAISELWLSNTQTDMPKGYTFVENKKINNLFRTLPLRVEALLEVLADEMSSSIDFKEVQPDQLKIGYALVAPIAVGEGFKLVYKERVTGLQNQLSELLKYTRALELTIVGQNNIPLDLSVLATALDASGNAIPVSVEAQGVLTGGTKQGGYKESTVVLSLKEKEPNALNRLDQIDLFFTGVAPAGETGATLQENQALKLKMSAKVPGGFNIKVTQ